MSRDVTHSYRDPLDQIWLRAARAIGLTVVRCDDAYAHKRSGRQLAIATSQHLDADDCLAQMIFHELCHSLVAGPESFELEDWGMDSASDDLCTEHACLRTQAFLAARHGLRSLLAPTTEHRAFYDALPRDPLQPARERSALRARRAIRLSQTAPWAPHLASALDATRAIAAIAAPHCDRDSLLRTVAEAPGHHPSGLGAVRAGERCGDCAWRDEAGFCQQARGAVDGDGAACERFEATLDCQDCGACCREAYHSVTVAEDDPAIEALPELLVRRDSYVELRRNGERCAALDGGRDARTPFHCRVYDLRPICCREFERGGENCLIARRRVGLSL